jgi:D-aminoacyl-tRNA deacylase
MRLVIQRVLSASVTINNEETKAISKGLLVFVGVHREDELSDVAWFVNKLLNLRLFEDQIGKMNLSIKDIQGELLVVSQFTLYGNCLNGRRPDFLQAAASSVAIPIYQKFVDELKKEI